MGFINKVESQKDLAIVTAEIAAKFEPRPEATTHFDLPEGIKIKILKIDGVLAQIEPPA